MARTQGCHITFFYAEKSSALGYGQLIAYIEKTD